jgi:hypothetical protein
MLGIPVDRHGNVDEVIAHPTEIICGLPQSFQANAKILLRGGATASFQIPSKSKIIRPFGGGYTA